MRTRSVDRDCRGSVLIELLMVLPILFVLLAAVFHIGRLVYAHQKVIIASRMAAERAASMLNPQSTNAREAMFYPYNYSGAPATLGFRLGMRRMIYLMGASRNNPPALAQLFDVSNWIGFPGKARAEQMVKRYLAYSLGIDPGRIRVEFRAIPYIRYLENQNGSDSIQVRRGGMDQSVGFLHPGEVRDNEVDNLTQVWWRENAQRESQGGNNSPYRITRYELPYGVWLVAAKVTVRYPTTPMVKALVGAASVLLGGIQLSRDEVVISRVTVFPAPLSAIDIVDATQSLRLAQFDTDKRPVPRSLSVMNIANPPSTWTP